MIRIAAALALALLSVSPGPSAGAQQAGRISGVVRDGQLRPMQAVRITLYTRTTTHTVVTDSVGLFSFATVERGRALIVTSREGFGATQRTELLVRGGDHHEVEITLYPMTGAEARFYDPDVNRPLNFAAPRGFSVAALGGLSTSTLAIGSVEASGSARAARAELGLEIDSYWMAGIRAGVSAGRTSENVDFRYNLTNTITYRDYQTRRLDFFVRVSPLRNTRRLRPYASGSFGLSRFSGDVRVTSLSQPASTTGSGIVLTVGGGLQYNVKRHLALDVGAEWSGVSFEEWRINNAEVGLPNLRVFGTDLVLAVRWWPRAW